MSDQELRRELAFVDPPTGAAAPHDFFVREDGLEFAGAHLLIDFWGASRLDDPRHAEVTLKRAALAAKAAVLKVFVHSFPSSGGVSAVAILAESHISLHTWPERQYAALDVFMCGRTTPAATLPVFRQAFAPVRVQVTKVCRGLV